MSILALGGAPLEGTKTVRLVYMDETGMSNKSDEPFLVVAGVIVHGDSQLTKVKERLAEIRDKYIPETQREKFVFHAKEIFNGGGKVFDRKTWPLDKRLEIAEQLALIPSQFDLRVAFGWINKNSFPNTFQFPPNTSKKQRLAYEHAFAYLSCASIVDNWVRQNTNDENCLLVVEDNQTSRNVIKTVHNDFQDIKYLMHEDELSKNMLHLQRIQEDPHFQEKKATNPLEIADFCAYVFKRYLMNQDDELYYTHLNLFRNQFADFDEERVLS